jgi:hypothetical protein
MPHYEEGHTVNLFLLLRKIPWWAWILFALVVGDLTWRLGDLKRRRYSLEEASRFQVLDVPGKEGGNCVTVEKQKQPVYAECDFGDGKVDAVEFYWQGRTILTLSIKGDSKEGGRSLTYYNEDRKKSLMLIDHEGKGEFHSRVIYGSDKPVMDVLLDGAWKRVEERDHRKGTVLDGEWFPLNYTNAAWTVVK